jgi:O-antigen ligase
MHHVLFVLVLIVLILTVSRSAWLAFAVGVAMLFLGEGCRLYQRGKGGWVQYLRKALHLIGLGVFALAVIFVFQLTRFHLGERAESTGSGYQSITVACEEKVSLPERIESLEELELYHCQHIRLEEIATQEQAGKSIKTTERRDPNFSIRSQIYLQSWQVLKTHFIFGIGLGNSAQFLGADERGAGLNTSNLFLETWLGSGLLGLVSLVALWVVLAIRFGWSMWRGIEPERYIVGLAMLAGVTVFNLFNAGMFLGVFFFVLAWLVTISYPPADYKRV